MIHSHTNGSSGSRELATALGCRRIKTENSRFKGGTNKLVINWGASRALVDIGSSRVLNEFDKVNLAANKLSTFDTFSASNDPPVFPEYTTDRQQAIEWQREGISVVARRNLRGSGGDGISIFSGMNDFVNAPLWVKYVKKVDEYRVHIFDGEVIDLQRKALRNDYEGPRNFQIRNLENGFIFARDGIENTPEDVKEQAKKAVVALGLTFGAVDVIFNANRNRAYVLEVNTAPGLQGTTIESYSNAIRTYLRNNNYITNN